MPSAVLAIVNPSVRHVKASSVTYHMSHGLLADSVDTSLGSPLYSCTTDAVFSEVHEKDLRN